MFCPKCATQNLEGAHFCRSCGANISLVPQALSGQLPQPISRDEETLGERYGRRRRRELSLDQSFKNVFMGIAFLLVALALARSIGRGWWFWMLIPAFSMIGTGIAQYIRLKEKEKHNYFGVHPTPPTFSERPATLHRELRANATGEFVPPVPSVTEGTTRHLGGDAATRHLDSDDQK